MKFLQPQQRYAGSMLCLTPAPPLPAPPRLAPACDCAAAGVLAADNEGALLGRVLLETTMEGAKQLSSHVLESLGRFFADEP
jgi:hypothetical protein